MYDGHSGLYQCNARYYDPSTARFLSKDPVRADGEMSGWMYCGGDPVGCVDPSGMKRVRVRSGHFRDSFKHRAMVSGANAKFEILVEWTYSAKSGKLRVWGHVSVDYRGQPKGAEVSVAANVTMRRSNGGKHLRVPRVASAHGTSMRVASFDLAYTKLWVYDLHPYAYVKIGGPGADHSAGLAGAALCKWLSNPFGGARPS